jgi:phosphate transport system permease protein
MIGVILYELWDGSRAAWAEWGLSFLTRTEWNPVRGEFGALPFIAGTLLTSLMALALALPVSLGHRHPPHRVRAAPVRDPLIFVVELLAAIPSVVFGLWGIFVLAPLMQRHHHARHRRHAAGAAALLRRAGAGLHLFTASVILAIMVIPIIASLSREVLLAVPRDQKEAALALGATRGRPSATWSWPTAAPGIFSAAVLGLGRAWARPWPPP